MKGTILFLDIHNLGLGVITLASVISLVLIILKAVGKEFESTALIWIRSWRNIQAERRKTLNIEPSAEQSQSLDETSSRRE